MYSSRQARNCRLQAGKGTRNNYLLSADVFIMVVYDDIREGDAFDGQGEEGI